MKLPPVLSSRHKEAIFLMKRMLCVLLTLLLCAASAQADAVLDTVDYDNAAEISTKSQDGTGCTSMSFWRTERRALRAIWATKRRW